jgi:hypothetical protein
MASKLEMMGFQVSHRSAGLISPVIASNLHPHSPTEPLAPSSGVIGHADASLEHASQDSPAGFFEKCLLLRGRHELEESCDRPQQLVPVAAIQEYPRDLSVPSIRAAVSRAYSITGSWLV